MAVIRDLGYAGGPENGQKEENAEGEEGQRG